jgi:predicted LPLAT superfamily acyltransferase
MSKWEGRTKAKPIGYRIFGFFVQKFGVLPAYFVLLFVAFYYYLFSHQSSRAILRFYRQRLHIPQLKALRMLFTNYYYFGQTLIDKFAVMAGLSPKFAFEHDGVEHLQHMVSLGKGGLLMSAHVGNYEISGQLLNRLQVPVNVVMYDGEDEGIKRYLESSTKKGFNVIFVKKDLSHIFQITAALAANEIVCIHADRYLPGNKTVTTDFFGAPALFPEGPFLLALRLHVPVLYVYGFKEGAMKYHLYSTPIKNFERANGDSVQTIAQDYTRSLEEMVKKYPEQWFNYYDFWDVEHTISHAG